MLELAHMDAISWTEPRRLGRQKRGPNMSWLGGVLGRIVGAGVVVGLILIGTSACSQRDSASPPIDAVRNISSAVSPPPIAFVAPIPDCETIRRKLADAQSRYAGQPRGCNQDADCACYGGPLCPNALVESCPSPIRAEVSRALQPLATEWQQKDCGAYTWSPIRCEAKCIHERCASSP